MVSALASAVVAAATADWAGPLKLDEACIALHTPQSCEPLSRCASPGPPPAFSPHEPIGLSDRHPALPLGQAAPGHPLPRPGMGRAAARRPRPLRIPDPRRRPGRPELVHHPGEAPQLPPRL